MISTTATTTTCGSSIIILASTTAIVAVGITHGILLLLLCRARTARTTIFSFLLSPRSRFRLNVSAGSQKRAIHEPEGRDESRLALKLKRTLNALYYIFCLYLDKSCHFWTNDLSGSSDVVFKTIPRYTKK